MSVHIRELFACTVLALYLLSLFFLKTVNWVFILIFRSTHQKQLITIIHCTVANVYAARAVHDVASTGPGHGRADGDRHAREVPPGRRDPDWTSLDKHRQSSAHPPNGLCPRPTHEVLFVGLQRKHRTVSQFQCYSDAQSCLRTVGV